MSSPTNVLLLPSHQQHHLQDQLRRKRASDIEKMCLIKKKKLFLSPVDLAFDTTKSKKCKK